jgi:hypothetical protein
MKSIIVFATITLAFANCSNAFGMILALKTKQSPMSSQRALSTIPELASTQNKRRYILSENRASFAVPQLSMGTYTELQKRFDRNQNALQSFRCVIACYEQNKTILDHTFYGRKFDAEKFNALENAIEKELKRFARQ